MTLGVGAGRCPGPAAAEVANQDCSGRTALVKEPSACATDDPLRRKQISHQAGDAVSRMRAGAPLRPDVGSFRAIVRREDKYDFVLA